ncbi:hypothetical protein ACIU0H_04990 [Pseudomonas aeruginosa]|uniref:hypothetical protein n=1 Tax=Pseudomonas aeruginosa TaxID=287 RepID=UPI001805F51C
MTYQLAFRSHERLAHQVQMNGTFGHTLHRPGQRQRLRALVTLQRTPRGIDVTARLDEQTRHTIMPRGNPDNAQALAHLLEAMANWEGRQ